VTSAAVVVVVAADSAVVAVVAAEAAASATSVAAVAVVVKADPAEERNYERGVLRKQGALFLSRPDELSALVERDSPGQLLQNCNPFIWACYLDTPGAAHLPFATSEIAEAGTLRRIARR
jgi:hypothetical protein